MPQFITTVHTELTVPLQVTRTGANFFSQDNMANRIVVEVYKNQILQTVTGDVMGFVMRDDGTTVFFPGGIDDGKAYIELPEEAYAVIGNVTIAVRLTSESGQKTTIALVSAYIKRYTTDSYADPTHVISNVDDLIANLDRIAQAAAVLGRVQGIIREADTLADQVEAARQEAVESAEEAAESAANALLSANDARLYAGLVSMDAVTHGIFHLEIDDRGHLIYTRTDSLSDLNVILQNGRLIIEYPLEE